MEQHDYKTRVRVDNIEYYTKLSPAEVRDIIFRGDILEVREFYGSDSRFIYVNTNMCRTIRVEAY